jgi:hypothetical protein
MVKDLDDFLGNFDSINTRQHNAGGTFNINIRTALRNVNGQTGKKLTLLAYLKTTEILRDSNIYSRYCGGHNDFLDNIRLAINQMRVEVD